jgi:predicted DNA-binding protein (UPF0251 family)
MNGPGSPQGRRARRGRRRVERKIDATRRYRCFGPLCEQGEPAGTVTLRADELELLRLTDLDGLTQEEAAAAIGVSRKTVWRDLHEARRKITEALIFGRAITVLGCTEQPGESCAYHPDRDDEDGDLQ